MGIQFHQRCTLEHSLTFSYIHFILTKPCKIFQVMLIQAHFGAQTAQLEDL